MALKKKIEDLEKRIENVETIIEQAGRLKSEATDRAREALLRHYTDQLVSHAALLLTIAIPALTALGICLEYKRPLLFLAILVASLLIGAWQVFRFLYHGRMAGHIMYRGPLTMDDLKSYMEQDPESSKQIKIPQKEGTIVLESERTEIYALNLGAQLFDRERYRKQYYLAHFLSVETRQKKPTIAIIYGVLLFCALALLVEESLALFLDSWMGPPIRFLLFDIAFVLFAFKYWNQ